MPPFQIPAHPLRPTWQRLDARQRATVDCTVDGARQFLVPFRTEGHVEPSDLPRGRLGFVPAVNRAWITGLEGHLSGAAVTRDWGPLSASSGATTGAPTGFPGEALFYDATGDGVAWPEFRARVLREMLGSLGGFVHVITDPRPAGVTRVAQQQAAGWRPRVQFVPWASVWDVQYTGGKLTRLVLLEVEDTRDGKGGGKYNDQRLLSYVLGADAITVTRTTLSGEAIGDVVTLPLLYGTRGTATLPFAPVAFGKIPEVSFVGGGLLRGLDDLVLDLYNQVVELRVSSREVYGLLTYSGTEAEEVKSQLIAGSALVALGADGELSRLQADGTAPQSIAATIALGLQLWASAAREKVASAKTQTDTRSGASIATDHTLRVRPLLTLLASTLDRIETDTLCLVAQMAGNSAVESARVVVTTDTAFSLEDEASRIARIVTELATAVQALRNARLDNAALVEPVVRTVLDSANIVASDRVAGIARAVSTEPVPVMVTVAPAVVPGRAA